MRDLYTSSLRTWFPEGLDDPHLTLIRFDAEAGVYWESPGGVLQLAFAYATAIVTRKPGQTCRSGTLSFG